MKAQRPVYLLLIFLCCGLVAVGCGGDDEPDGSDETTETASGATGADGASDESAESGPVGDIFTAETGDEVTAICEDRVEASGTNTPVDCGRIGQEFDDCVENGPEGVPENLAQDKEINLETCRDIADRAILY